MGLDFLSFFLCIADMFVSESKESWISHPTSHQHPPLLPPLSEGFWVTVPLQNPIAQAIKTEPSWVWYDKNTLDVNSQWQKRAQNITTENFKDKSQSIYAARLVLHGHSRKAD